MRVGVLTGGGDAPGLNAAIRAVARRCFQRGDEAVGIRNGWAGLVGDGDVRTFSPIDVSGILHLGGTILGTSRTNPLKMDGGMDQVLANMQRFGLDALVAIGGDDTLSVACRLDEMGGHVVGVPKTVDNDLSETDYCIGFDTAVHIVTDALDRLHTTANAHSRVLVVEVMGRDAGWVAVAGGLAGGADFILIPEVPLDIDRVCDHLHRRTASGKGFSIIVVSEGVSIDDGSAKVAEEVDAFGHVRLDRRGVGDHLSRIIEARTGMETRVTVLGHLQRGGSPTAYDRLWATRLGVRAVDLIADQQFGLMVSVKGGDIRTVPISQAVGKMKLVDRSLYDLAEIFY